MTPEERLNRIESVLERHIEFVADSISKQNENIDKQNEGIRGLIVVARTCIDSAREMGDRHEKDHERLLAEILKVIHAQATTDEKLNTLIDTVDRIIRRDGKE